MSRYEPKYGDVVKVKNGFYEGREGYLYKPLFTAATGQQYIVFFDDLSHDILYFDNLEFIRRKT